MDIISNIDKTRKIGLQVPSWRTVGLVSLAIVGYFVFFSLFYNLMVDGKLWPYTSTDEVLRQVSFNLLPIALLTVITLAIVFLNPIRSATWLKMGVDLVLCIITLIVYNVLFMLLIAPGANINWAGTAFNSVLIYLAVEVAYYVANFRRTLRENEAQKRMVLQYQYDALKAQVNPHFLFNSLNILYSLVKVEPASSEDFILSLSRIYRYVMQQHGQATVRLADEIAFLCDYASILSMRYRNQFDVHVNGISLCSKEWGEQQVLSDEQKNSELIPFTMQLLIENVAKHNVISSVYHTTVYICVANDHLTVSNHVVPRSSESVSHFGLRYLTELYGMHGREFRIENDGKTFTAIVPFL